MIKANELRIGNFIWSNPNGGEGTVIELHTISKQTVYGRSLNGQLHNLKIDLDRWNDPIPITREWFERFGFDYSGEDLGNYYYHSCGKSRLDINQHFMDEGEWSAEIRYISVIEIAVIKYVHQLQNLYFALTQQELTVKELA